MRGAEWIEHRRRFLHGTIVRVAPGVWATEILMVTGHLILPAEFGAWAAGHTFTNSRYHLPPRRYYNTVVYCVHDVLLLNADQKRGGIMAFSSADYFQWNTGDVAATCQFQKFT